MKFDNWEEMYNYLTNEGNPYPYNEKTGKRDRHDLYNIKTGDYVCTYNEGNSLILFNFNEEQVKELIEKCEENEAESWNLMLFKGGNVLEDMEHYCSDEDKKEMSLFLKPSFDYCQRVFSEEGWTKPIEYEKPIIKEYEKQLWRMLNEEIIDVFKKYDNNAYEFYKNKKHFGIAPRKQAMYLMKEHGLSINTIDEEEIMEILKKYDYSLYNFYQQNGDALGITAKNYAAYLLDKHKEEVSEDKEEIDL